MMDSNQQFCLRWHNYQSSLLASLPQLLDGDDLTDVTLSAGGRNLRAHRVVLSACSQYFKDLFKVLQPLQHPVIVLPGANFTDLCALVTFMYSGEVNIYQEQLPGLLSMADAMQIRGLAEVNGTSGKNAETHAPKKDLNPSSMPKRAKMTSHSAQNQTPATEGRAMQAETVDMHGHLLKGKSVEYELYGTTGMGHTSKQPAVMDSEVQYASLQLRDEGPTKSQGLSSDNLEHYVDSIVPKRLTRREEGTTPLLSLVASPSERVKVEQESNTRISPDLASVLKRAAGMEEMELSSVEGAQAQQSPSSEDSGGGSSYGPDPSMAAAVSAATAAANRVHLSPGPHFSSLKFSYSSSSSSPSANSRAGVAVSSNVTAGKLFATCLVCGKQLSNQYNLRVHMETHQNVNYACGVCSHVSRSRDALRKHVSYRHPPEGRDKSATLSGAREGRKGANGLEGKIRAPIIPSGNNGLGVQSTEMNVDNKGDVTGIRAASQLVAEDMTSKKSKVASSEENIRP